MMVSGGDDSANNSTRPADPAGALQGLHALKKVQFFSLEKSHVKTFVPLLARYSDLPLPLKEFLPL